MRVRDLIELLKHMPQEEPAVILWDNGCYYTFENVHLVIGYRNDYGDPKTWREADGWEEEPTLGGEIEPLVRLF